MNGETILILASGLWDNHRRLDRLVSRADYIIAANGGWAKARQRGIHVDIVVGDLDSLTPEDRKTLLESPATVHSYPHDKDWTDLELALDHALSRLPSRIVIFGALGDRLDHTLANVFLLEKGCLAGVSVELVSAHETAWLVNDVHEIPSVQLGDRVSLLAITDRAEVKTSGLRYALNGEFLYRTSSHGISNEVIALPVQIEVKHGALLVVHASTMVT
ncbi:TPA: thiamine diphosphokinase [Candidatus Acetothermia bacterium]|nr:thiamine diphosphokinase [Candidatus Acetothermia bacterium]HAZ30101.1 thiamine diphosphokinase [Candidatus Acetothermia bacterium]